MTLRYGNDAARQPPSVRQIQDALDRLNHLHQWFRKHHVAISEDPQDHLWKLNDARTERGNVAVDEAIAMDEEDLKEIMRHFNGMNNAYLIYAHASSSESKQASSKTFYEHRDWLEEHGMKVRLCSQGFWVEDEEGGT